MIYSFLLQTNAWITAAVRNIYPVQASITFPERRRELLGALALMLVLATGLFAVSPTLQAQDGVAVVEIATVNINTADAAALAASLNGVGEARAQEIVRYREAYGPFATVEELTEVKGIGQSTLDRNRKLITLE